MPFDAPRTGPRIAVIGAGVAGMTAAHFLAPQARVTLFEAEPRLGGHARTVRAGLDGAQPVDTGFIVFNYANYPHLARLFQDLDVPVARSDMSFGVSIDGGRLEYSFRSLQALLAQPANAARPGFLRMLRDIHRFNAQAEARAVEGQTVGDLTRELGLGDWFRRCYLRPICGAIWSTPETEIDAYPARTLVDFFRNHGLLGLNGHHQWWTVQGGSVEYVRRLETRLVRDGVRIETGAPVRAVARDEDAATLHFSDRPSERFDEVVLACHSDDALRLLARPTPAESRALGAVRFRPNRVVLHRDPRQMPLRRACWSAWVYRSTRQGSGPGVGVTYWMNRLQNIPETDPLFVSMNPADEIPEALIYDETVFRHPVFDQDAVRAQSQIAALQGQNRTWFAGAWLRNGFHEDGVASALRIARRLAPAPA